MCGLITYTGLSPPLELAHDLGVDLGQCALSLFVDPAEGSNHAGELGLKLRGRGCVLHAYFSIAGSFLSFTSVSSAACTSCGVFILDLLEAMIVFCHMATAPGNCIWRRSLNIIVKIRYIF